MLLLLLVLLLLMSPSVLFEGVLVVAVAAAAAAVGVMLTLALRQHTSFKKLVALLLPASALAVAKVMEVAAGGEIGGAQADFQAVGAAAVVGGLCMWREGGRRGGGKANVSVNLTQELGRERH